MLTVQKIVDHKNAARPDPTSAFEIDMSLIVIDDQKGATPRFRLSKRHRLPAGLVRQNNGARRRTHGRCRLS